MRQKDDIVGRASQVYWRRSSSWAVVVIFFVVVVFLFSCFLFLFFLLSTEAFSFTHILDAKRRDKEFFTVTFQTRPRLNYGKSASNLFLFFYFFFLLLAIKLFLLSSHTTLLLYMFVNHFKTHILTTVTSCLIQFYPLIKLRTTIQQCTRTFF